MANDFYKIVAESGTKTGQIIMTGFISPWENSAIRLREDFKNLEQSYSIIDILIYNLFGGSVIEGIPTYNLFKNSKATTNTEVEGLAASMGSILFLAANGKKTMNKMSRLMLHRPKNGIYGDYEDLKEGSEMLFGYHEDLIDVYLENSNRDKKYIQNNWMVRGKDAYLTAKQALDFGLVTEITEGTVTKNVPNSLLKNGTVNDVVNFYTGQIPNIQNLLNNSKTPIKMEKENLALGLPKDATEDQRIEAISKLKEKGEATKEETQTPAKVEAKKEGDDKTVTALQDKIAKLEEQNKKDKATGIVDAAIAAGKIVEGDRKTYEALAIADPENTKKILAEKKAYKSVTDQLDKGEPENKHAGKDWNWLHKNDPAYLTNLRKTDQAAYDELFKNRKRP